MDLERLNRLQWCLIGLAAGLIIAFSRWMFVGEYDGHSLDKNFDRIVTGTAEQPARIGFLFGPQQWSYLSDVVVHPPVPEDRKSDPGGDSPVGTPIYWVTGKLHEMKFVVDHGKARFEEASVSDFFHRGPAPYKTYGKSYPTVMALLDEVARQSGGKSGRYHFAWWEKPSAIWSIYPIAGVVLVGGVWPFIIQLMVGLGLGRRRDTPSTNLANYASEPARKPQPKLALTKEDITRLDALSTTMEAELMDAATKTPALAAEPQRSAPRSLETAPLDTIATKPVPAKSFGEDDYYPTEIHRPAEGKPAQQDK